MSMRDPETGQFVAQSGSNTRYEDMEQVTGRAQVRSKEDDREIHRAELIDLDEIVDRRRELAHLVSGVVRLTSYATNQENAGSILTATAIATIGTGSEGYDVATGKRITERAGGSAVERTDSMDPIAPPLITQANNTGPSGAGGRSAGSNTVTSQSHHIDAAGLGDPVFDAREEIVAEIQLSPGVPPGNDSFAHHAEVTFMLVFGLAQE